MNEREDSPDGAVRPLRAVVADDHAHVREMVRRLLDQAEGITVVGTAADGRQALELVGELGPDVVVMDLSMPVLDGIEATRRLVAGHRATVVALTVSTALARRALEAGAAAFVFKDSEPEELIRAIRLAVTPP